MRRWNIHDSVNCFIQIIYSMQQTILPMKPVLTLLWTLQCSFQSHKFVGEFSAGYNRVFQHKTLD